MSNNRLNFWFRTSLLSLVIVALYGLMMRYKIVFDFPFFSQKNLLHAHSHFAFSGWISHFLYCGLAQIAFRHIAPLKKRKYIRIIGINFVLSLGMLLSFTIQGYGAISIIFSTLTIIISVLYSWFFIRDSRNIRFASKSWAITGLLLNIMSSLGPLTLAYMLASKNIDQDLYLSSVYYFLHFQYNGWFFFGAMAVVISHLPHSNFSLNRFFPYYAFTVVPTFLLSVLWIDIPEWLYLITVMCTLIQLVVWLMTVRTLRISFKISSYSKPPVWLILFMYCAVTAMTIKFVLQAISVIPSLSQLVFGFRPIVIAYLHLILLGVYSLFFVGYLFITQKVRLTVSAGYGGLLFISGVFLNEIFLAIQGFAAFSYNYLPFVNELLFAAAVILFVSSVVLFLSQFSNAGSLYQKNNFKS